MRKLAYLCFIFPAFGCRCHAPPPAGGAEGNAAPRASTTAGAAIAATIAPTQKSHGTPMRSYVTPFGSTRSSRVHVPPRPRYQFVRAGRIEIAKAYSYRWTRPQFVLLNEAATRVIVDLGNWFEIHATDWSDRRDGGTFHFGTLYAVEDSVLMEGEMFLVGDRRSWGPVNAQLGDNKLFGDRPAQRLEGLRFFFVVQNLNSEDPHSDGHENDKVPPDVIVEQTRAHSPERAFADNEHWQPVWAARFEGRGQGAIADDLRMAVAMQDGRFFVLDGDTGSHLVDRRIAFSPSDISAVGTSFVLLAKTEHGTSVLFLDAAGDERARGEVSFEALQPPIDAGNGRVYIMGRGVAAFQDGKRLFANAYADPMFGTAFADGSMAIAAGVELRIVGPDGKARQTFTTAEGDPITTPPAIGSDGSVWVGTEKAIYVAR